MGTNRLSKSCTGRTAASSLLACVGAGAILFTAALAFAQEGADTAPARPRSRGFFGKIAHWFDEQASKVGSGFKGARSGVENFGHEAGIAAKTTVEGAKDAADAVTRIPSARVVTGHEKCTIAPNGAPDCVVAANAICKTKGFELRQERRHDHRRGLPAAGLSGRPQQRRGLPHRDLRLPRALPIDISCQSEAGGRLCRRRRLCFRRAA